MDDARQGRAAAAVVVGRGPRDGPGGRKAAEKRTHEVRHPLRDEFRVAVVTLARKPVRHHRREQGFNRPEEGDYRRRTEEAPDQVEVPLEGIAAPEGSRNRPRAEPASIVATAPSPPQPEAATNTVAPTMATMEPGNEPEFQERPEQDQGDACRREASDRRSIAPRWAANHGSSPGTPSAQAPPRPRRESRGAAKP